MEPAERKRRLRAAMARRRAGLDADAARRAGEGVAGLLTGTPEFAAAARLALYAALPGELPTEPLARAARRAGKPLLWPRVNAEDALEFAPCDRPEELEPGRFGVPVPPAERATVTLAPDDLVVVPGLAFDAAGGRLGRGGGHYDRAFARRGAAGPRLVGVAFAFQLVDEVPRDAWDRDVDLLVTEAEVLRSAPRAAPGAPGTR